MAKTAAKSSTKKSNVVPIKKSKPTVTAKSSTKEAKPAKKKTAENSKYIGKTTGMRVQAFQDKLMKDNYKAKKTDAQLAKEMRAEFPNAVVFNENHIAGIRSQFNNGRRASQEGQKPAKPLPRFDEEGNPMAPRTRGEGGSKKAKGSSKKAKAAAEDEDVEEDDEEADEEDVDEEDVEEEEEEEEADEE